ncbi:MAG: hypothetical protein HY253_14385 [Burkholderiales bacterium]|nr:hypothetical protein [Burkholderiales bacterium]
MTLSKLAGVNFQFRDLRAKAATDTQDLAHAQKLLGHKNRATTEIYTRDRIGDLVKPLKRGKSSSVIEKNSLFAKKI